MRSVHPGRPLTRKESKARYFAKNPTRPAEYRAENKDKLAAQQRARSALNREGEKARVVEWQQKYPERYKAAQEANRARKMDAQERKAGRARPDTCEICDEAPKDGKRLAFDHCHAQGHFRGWLCLRCNLALGLAKDDPTLLKKLADYLYADMLAERVAALT
jgi:hypothetical protein